MKHAFTASYLEDALRLFQFYRRQAEGAMEQVTDEQLYATLAGNMRALSACRPAETDHAPDESFLASRKPAYAR